MQENIDPVISLKDLWLVMDTQAGRVEILRGLNLEVQSGDSVCVTGPSGAGKTSLMMVIGGMERPTGGTVKVAGNELTQLDENALAKFRRRNVGIVFQSFHLIPTMTALENAALPLELAGAADAMEQARAELAVVGLSHRLGHYPSQLSGGEQQRVAIARALISGPDLILADEPTGNLDKENGILIMDLLFSACAKRDATLLLITHQPEIAENCSVQVGMLDGKITPPAASYAVAPDRQSCTA